MRILGIDTSGKTASAAILDTTSDILLGTHSIYTSRTQSQVMLPLCRQLLENCHLTVPEIDGFAVAVGPGSYTGLRIGIAAVQGMAMVRNTSCAGVSTLAALACGVGVGKVLAVLYARGTMFYYGLYDFGQPQPDMLRHRGVLADITDIRQVLQAHAGSDVVLAGDDRQFLEQWQEVGADVPVHLVQPVAKMPSAVGVCACAARTGFGTVSDLTANYLQAVQIQKKHS